MDIERLIREENWPQARKAIRLELKAKPDSHWLLTRLSLTYYEQRQYKTALRYVEKAKAIMPKCPLVLWDQAGTLQMLSRHAEAIDIYLSIIRRGIKRLANGDCGEGIAWARGMIADCYYRMASSLEKLGDKDNAMAAFTAHLDMRGPGCRSIYPLREIARRRDKLANSRVLGPTRRSTGSARKPRTPVS